MMPRAAKMAQMSPISAQLRDRILQCWFAGYEPNKPTPPSCLKRWFGGAKETDDEIRTKFGVDVEQAIQDDTAYADLMSNPDGALALTILCDQFPRNIYRDTARAFSGDPRALRIANNVIEAKMDKQVIPIQRAFFYLPLMHSERMDMQDLCIKKYQEMVHEVKDDTTAKEMATSFLSYAEKHRDIIEKFGRYPHRNAVLGRQSTQEEIDYLTNGGETFAAKK